MVSWIKKEKKMLRSLEFVKTTEQYNQTIEEDEKDFVYIAKILTKTLGWKLTQKITLI